MGNGRRIARPLGGKGRRREIAHPWAGAALRPGAAARDKETRVSIEEAGQERFPGEIEARFLMSLVVEANMLLKTMVVRCDLRKLAGSTQFLSRLNLKKLSDCGSVQGVLAQKNIKNGGWSH